ncbi:MAG TPA: putative DNA-binding protein [Pseudogracilibacillus sp.]|nr:putative DNA-binding protein [Pseudogracilibacillus sp.]
MIEKTTEINMLYDFYYKLLTKKQQSYMEMYYREDYSLGEISELTNVSRQAVYDTIRRTEKLLQSYEDCLSLYSKFQKRQQLTKTLNQEALKYSENEDLLEIIHQLQKID